ncbi:DUF6894 family protein [Bradyrhizobium betae]|uniref:DUF6894 domain-containing protein n=1 Tax=Bradyrhizobium betae TaxID=244734 RepID=A0A4Q1VNW9_9BRAD|nr:hypothetical protein [Bradyrhizobium betae]RXT54298.1 hypothetical protein B5V03_02365 [Bradyrhizobium betae]
MPRYYFDLLDGGVLACDEEGLLLPNLQAAQAEAARSLADMARDAVDDLTATPDKRDMAIEVRDAAGPVMQVKFTFEIERSKH